MPEAENGQPEALYSRTVDFLWALTERPEKERELLTEAMFAAAEFHGEQKRIGGLPYIVHPLEVATILMEHGADIPTVIAGLLHDVLEDTQTPGTVIENRFGTEALRLIEAASHNLFPDKETMRQEVYVLSQKDPRIADLKIADRLANTHTMLSLREERHLANLEETDSFHLGKLAGLPGVNPELAGLLRSANQKSWTQYRSRIAS